MSTSGSSGATTPQQYYDKLYELSEMYHTEYQKRMSSVTKKGSQVFLSVEKVKEKERGVTVASQEKSLGKFDIRVREETIFVKFLRVCGWKRFNLRRCDEVLHQIINNARPLIEAEKEKDKVEKITAFMEACSSRLEADRQTQESKVAARHRVSIRRAKVLPYAVPDLVKDVSNKILEKSPEQVRLRELRTAERELVTVWNELNPEEKREPSPPQEVKKIDEFATRVGQLSEEVTRLLDKKKGELQSKHEEVQKAVGQILGGPATAFPEVLGAPKVQLKTLQDVEQQLLLHKNRLTKHAEDLNRKIDTLSALCVPTRDLPRVEVPKVNLDVREFGAWVAQIQEAQKKVEEWNGAIQKSFVEKLASLNAKADALKRDDARFSVAIPKDFPLTISGWEEFEKIRGTIQEAEARYVSKREGIISKQWERYQTQYKRVPEIVPGSSLQQSSLALERMFASLKEGISPEQLQALTQLPRRIDEFTAEVQEKVKEGVDQFQAGRTSVSFAV